MMMTGRTQAAFLRRQSCLRLGMVAAILLVCGVRVQIVRGADVELKTRDLKGFLTTYCSSCHDKDSQEAGLDLFSLSSNLSDAATQASWIRVFDRVTSGEMPPAEESQPRAEERQTFLSLLDKDLTQAHAEIKGTVLRRLNRREFQNTLNDIFGTHLNLVDLLPEDGRSHEFDNVGSALSISMVQMQRYMEAMDLVLESAIATTTQKPESKVIRAGYAETRGAEKFLGRQWLKLDDESVVFFRRLGYPTGMLREASVRRPGFYKIRVTGYAHQSETPITFSIGATTFQRGAARPTFSYHAMPTGGTTVEIVAWMESNYMVQIEPYGISDNYQIKTDGIENYRGPGLAISHVEVEGPLISEFPSRGHQFIFSGLTRTEKEPSNPSLRSKSWYQPEFEISDRDVSQKVPALLSRIASRAFRRPVSETQVAPYVNLFAAEQSRNNDAEESLKTAIIAIFCAPDFLFLKEQQGTLDDFMLATRLSYFLTRTAPDRLLRESAAAGRLQAPDELRRQVERLLRHKHHARFVEDFCDAWLNLRDLDFTVPDRVLYPEFDPFLNFSILRETRAYLAEMIRHDLPVRNVVKSDFAMLNNRLAEHYELAGVDGPQIRRVSLPADSIRGGFLTQASVLKVSANGTNTSPVVRGVYVMERLLGHTPPPPPPGISGVEPDIRGAMTLRELLDRHRDVDSCRSCHQQIDPPGFALECFDPIGTYRDRFRSIGDGEKVARIVHGDKVRYRLALPVDASGEYHNQPFGGFRDFRDLLAADEDQLVRALAEKLLTFATGREPGYSDRKEIDRIVRQSSTHQHGLRHLIHLVVQSEIFRHK